MFASLVPSSRFNLTIVGDGIGGEPIMSKHLTFTFKHSGEIGANVEQDKIQFRSNSVTSSPSGLRIRENLLFACFCFDIHTQIMFRMLGIHLFYPWHRNPNSNDRDNPVGLGSHPWLLEKCSRELS